MNTAAPGDRDREILQPSKFMSAAERYQMMPAIDAWVIENTFAALAQHSELLARRMVKFSINLSAQSLGDDALIGIVDKACAAARIPPDLICFELTETAAVGNLARSEEIMQELRSMGFQFALDDFGTGQSSLAYLKSLPVSILKIDGTFVRDSMTNTRSADMVKAISQLARTMGMTTVAEYVESDELRTQMANLGVDYGQGFAIGKPVPLAEVLADVALYADLDAHASDTITSRLQLVSNGAPLVSHFAFASEPDALDVPVVLPEPLSAVGADLRDDSRMRSV